MFLTRLFLKKFKKIIKIYCVFLKNCYKKDILFQENYSFCFYPTTPHRQLNFNIYHFVEEKSSHISSGTLLKPHFDAYHSMKKNFTHIQKIVYLVWLFLENIQSEPFYFYIQAYNAVIYNLIKQIYVIFVEPNITYIISKPYNFLTKYRKRIKKKTWKLLVASN